MAIYSESRASALAKFLASGEAMAQWIRPNGTAFLIGFLGERVTVSQIMGPNEP